MKLLSVKGTLSFGWERFKEEPWRIVSVIATGLIVSLFSSYILGEITKGLDLVITVLAAFFDFAVQTLVGIGFIAAALKAHDSIGELKINDLWAPEYFWRYLFATVLVGIIVLLGFILLIVPGIIAMVTLMFTPYLVVDRNMGPIEAMKKSRDLTKGHRWKLLLLIIIIALLNLAGSLAFLVGLLITIPISIIAIAHAYRTLEKQSTQTMGMVPDSTAVTA